MKQLVLIFTVSLLAVCSSANAGFEFQFEADGGTDISMLTAGQSVTGSVFVAATGTDIPLFTQLQGLSFGLARTSGGASISSYVNDFPGLGGSTSFTTTSVTQTPTFGAANAVNGRVQIGSLAFTAGAAGDTSVFVFQDPNTSTGDNVRGVVNGTGIGLDAQVFGSSFSVTAVPEPSSALGLLALAGIGLMRRRCA